MSYLLAAGALIFAAGCSGTPTAPSSLPSSTSDSGGTAQGAAQDASGEAVTSPQDVTSGVLPGALGATKFVAFGDSLTRGIESSPDGTFLFDAGPTVSYPYQLLNGLINNHPSQAGSFVVDNEGVGGETAATGSQRLQTVLIARRPQVLLLLEGINDLNNGAGVNATISRLQTMIEIARVHNVTVLIANMFQTYAEPGKPNAADLIPAFNAGIAQIAQGQRNVFLVDLHNSFASVPDARSLVGGDGLHPTPSGYARIADRFRSTIMLAFPVRGAFQ